MKNVSFKEDFKKITGKEPPPLTDSRICEKIIQVCRQEGAGFHQGLALALKAEWESAGGNGGRRQHETQPGGEVQIRNPGSKFPLDAAALFEVFECADGGWASASGYNFEQFNVLVRQMLVARLHLCSAAGPEMFRFTECALQEKALFAREDKQEIERQFLFYKERWLLLQDELGECLLSLERIRLRNANINREWMGIFGGAYARYLEAEYRLEIYRKKTLLLDANPGMTAKGLEEKLHEIMKADIKHIEAVRLEAVLARAGFSPSPAGTGASYEELKEHRQISKRILREIYLLIHPDALAQQAAYHALTENQKEQIQNLWHEVMKLNEDELGFDYNCLGGTYRAIPILLDKLELAKTILENAGIDMDPRLVIRGDTAAQRIQWLQASIRTLECAVLSAQAEHKLLLENEEIDERTVMIGWPVIRQDEMKRQYEIHAEQAAEEADKLELTIQMRLAGR